MASRQDCRARRPHTVHGSTDPELLQTFFRNAATTRAQKTAVRQLREYLDREPLVTDLQTETVWPFLFALRDSGLKPQSVNRTASAIAGFARMAVEAGKLPDIPEFPRFATTKPEPWNADELNKLLASARTMPGDVSGIPAQLWWPALMLGVLDTTVSYADLLKAPASSFQHRRGTLAIGPLVYGLHAYTVEAFDRIRRYDRERLLPWTLDNGRPPYGMLYREFKTVLYRAGIPHVQHNQLDRLRITATKSRPLETLDLTKCIIPRNGKPVLPRARDIQSRAQQRPATGPDSAATAVPELVLLETNSARSLKRFFEDVYRPRRLSQAKRKSIADHRGAVSRLCDFTGRSVTLDELSDELLEAFMLWRLETGRTPETVNGDRACLLAQWRYAWRKKFVETQPRGVEKLETLKRIPEAWSLDELGMIIASAEQEPGDICGIPCRLYWPALIQANYDTGLRINALLSVRVADVDFTAGCFTVHAEDQKHKADQALPIPDDTLARILATEPQGREWLFPVPWKEPRQPLTRRYRRILKRAGLKHGQRDLFHKIRRTSATYIADAEGEQAAQELMGHSSPQLTRRYYIDPRKVQRRLRIAERMPRPKSQREAS